MLFRDLLLRVLRVRWHWSPRLHEQLELLFVHLHGGCVFPFVKGPSVGQLARAASEGA
jgi:hypothetical protein